MSSKTPQKLFQEFMEQCENYYGQNLQILEAISTDKANFDRHFTSYSLQEFVLKRVGWRISGARVMFDGEKLYYEVAFDHLIAVEFRGTHEMELLEQYGESIFRKSRLRFGQST